MNPYSGFYGMGNRTEAILNDEEIKALNCQNGGQLPKIAGDLALAFGNVLRSVALHVGELEGQLAYIDIKRGHFERIRDECARGANLAYQLLLFSGNIRVKLELMDLNDLIRNIDPIISGTVRKGVCAEIDMADEALWVNGDAMLLRHVLANLVSNANDAMTQGGSIAVATRRVVRERRLPDMGWENFHSACALLSIVNSKPGIEDSIRHRIFEPFFTTKPPGKGMGLGLPIVQTIVRAHHGCINIVSKKDIGTIVNIYLPLAAHENSNKPTWPK